MRVYDINRYCSGQNILPSAIEVPDELNNGDNDTLTANIIAYIENKYGVKPEAFGYRANGCLVKYRTNASQNFSPLL